MSYDSVRERNTWLSKLCFVLSLPPGFPTSENRTHDGIFMAEKGVSLRSFFRYDKESFLSLKVGWMMVGKKNLKFNMLLRERGHNDGGFSL